MMKKYLLICTLLVSYAFAMKGYGEREEKIFYYRGRYSEKSNKSSLEELRELHNKLQTIETDQDEIKKRIAARKKAALNVETLQKDLDLLKDAEVELLKEIAATEETLRLQEQKEENRAKILEKIEQINTESQALKNKKEELYRHIGTIEQEEKKLKIEYDQLMHFLNDEQEEPKQSKDEELFSSRFSSKNPSRSSKESSIYYDKEEIFPQKIKNLQNFKSINFNNYFKNKKEVKEQFTEFCKQNYQDIVSHYGDYLSALAQKLYWREKAGLGWQDKQEGKIFIALGLPQKKNATYYYSTEDAKNKAQMREMVDDIMNVLKKEGGYSEEAIANFRHRNYEFFRDNLGYSIGEIPASNKTLGQRVGREVTRILDKI